MTPVDASQTDHCPEEGRYGDCHSAALASMLDLTLDQVPLFFDGRPARECWDHVAEFLASYDLALVDVVFGKEFTLEEVLRSQQSTNPDVYYTLGVCSPKGHGHTVVCCGGEVVHDPTYPVDVTQYRPMDDGFWWVGYLVPLGLTRRSR